MSLKIGDYVPKIALPDQNGEEFKLDSLIGKQAFVIYFYPKNFTPGCTAQACSFRDQYEDFKMLGAEVIGISSDSEESHSKFVNKHNLPYLFLADKDKRARKSFGVRANLLGLLPGRETFIFDKNGVLQFKFNSMNATRHIPEALDAIKRLK